MDAERYIERAKEYVTKEDDGQSFSVYLLGHHIGTKHYPLGQQTLYIDTVRKFASALAAESAEAEHWAWEAAIEIVLEEVSIAHLKEKQMLACMSRLRARAAARTE